MGEQVVRPADDLDLTHVAARDPRIEDIGDVLDERCELVIGVVAQLSAVIAAGQRAGSQR